MCCCHFLWMITATEWRTGPGKETMAVCPPRPNPCCIDEDEEVEGPAVAVEEEGWTSSCTSRASQCAGESQMSTRPAMQCVDLC